MSAMDGGALRRTLLIALCDLRMALRERSVLLWLFAMPLVFVLFFGRIPGGGSGRAPLARLTVEDGDGGALSRDLVALLAHERYQIVLADTMAAGADPVRTLVIPEGFTEGVLGRRRVELSLRREPGSNAEAGAAVSAAVFRACARLVTGLIEIEDGIIRDGSRRLSIEGDSLSGSLLLEADGDPRRLAGIESRLDSIIVRPAGVAVESVEAGRLREVPSGYRQAVPGILVQFVLMAMLFSGAGIAAERAGGILRRYGMTPAGKGEVVAGKLLGRMGTAAVQIVFLLLCGRFLFGVALGDEIPALAALMISFAFCTGALSILFGSFFTDPDQVTGFAVVIALALSALGGCWWPLEIVGPLFRTIAGFLPTGWAMIGLHRLISFGHGPFSVLWQIAALTAAGALFTAIGARRLRWDLSGD